MTVGCTHGVIRFPAYKIEEHCQVSRGVWGFCGGFRLRPIDACWSGNDENVMYDCLSSAARCLFHVGIMRLQSQGHTFYSSAFCAGLRMKKCSTSTNAGGCCQGVDVQSYR
jgi:hypothetical protein